MPLLNRFWWRCPAQLPYKHPLNCQTFCHKGTKPLRVSDNSLLLAKRKSVNWSRLRNEFLPFFKVFNFVSFLFILQSWWPNYNIQHVNMLDCRKLNRIKLKQRNSWFAIVLRQRRIPLFLQWPQYARTVRASVLAEKKKEYVDAVRVIGLRAPRIMFRHILPNTLSPILVISTVQVANAIVSEAALSFLGLGMPVTKPSLGSLINSGFEFIFSGSWWITIIPGIVLVILVLVMNLLGDFLRDVLNPKLYKN